jgi:hypothetical protein
LNAETGPRKKNELLNEYCILLFFVPFPAISLSGSIPFVNGKELNPTVEKICAQYFGGRGVLEGEKSRGTRRKLKDV